MKSNYSLERIMGSFYTKFYAIFKNAYSFKYFIFLRKIKCSIKNNCDSMVYHFLICIFICFQFRERNIRLKKVVAHVYILFSQL